MSQIQYKVIIMKTDSGVNEIYKDAIPVKAHFCCCSSNKDRTNSRGAKKCSVTRQEEDRSRNIPDNNDTDGSWQAKLYHRRWDPRKNE